MSITFSIITPSLNCREYISENIKSVKNQDINNNQIEHWIIDGLSTDGTTDYLSSELDIKWISEPDNGLSHAVNKGIKLSSGDWIIWLNADDMLAPNALKILIQHIIKFPKCKMFCGAQNVLNYDGNVEFTNQGYKYSVNDLLEKQTGIIQASTIVHREVYEKVGLLDEENHMFYTMDYEWILRAAKHYETIVIPDVLSIYRRRKDSITDTLEGTYKQHKDFLSIRRKYKCSRFSLQEIKLNFYLISHPLRRINWLRSIIRKIKIYFGISVYHTIHD